MLPVLHLQHQKCWNKLGYIGSVMYWCYLARRWITLELGLHTHSLFKFSNGQSDQVYLSWISHHCCFQAPKHTTQEKQLDCHHDNKAPQIFGANSKQFSHMLWNWYVGVLFLVKLNSTSWETLRYSTQQYVILGGICNLIHHIKLIQTLNSTKAFPGVTGWCMQLQTMRGHWIV